MSAPHDNEPADPTLGGPPRCLRKRVRKADAGPAASGDETAQKTGETGKSAAANAGAVADASVTGSAQASRGDRSMTTDASAQGSASR
jgi:transcription elongation factor